MGDLTRNISRHELVCKCDDSECSFTILDHEPIIQDVQDVCDWCCDRFNVDRVVLKITSPARCTVYNRKIGSNDNSQHPRANAIDYQIFINGEQVSPKIIHSYALARWPNDHGMGLYKDFNHLDDRPVKARW